MEDSVLIAGTALMFLFGWVLMKRLDRFLDENQRKFHFRTTNPIGRSRNLHILVL